MGGQRKQRVWAFLLMEFNGHGLTVTTILYHISSFLANSFLQMLGASTSQHSMHALGPFNVCLVRLAPGRPRVSASQQLVVSPTVKVLIGGTAVFFI